MRFVKALEKKTEKIAQKNTHNLTILKYNNKQ